MEIKAQGTPADHRVSSFSYHQWANVDLMAGQRRGRWPAIKSTLASRLHLSKGAIICFLRQPFLIYVQETQARENILKCSQCKLCILPDAWWRRALKNYGVNFTLLHVTFCLLPVLINIIMSWSPVGLRRFINALRTTSHAISPSTAHNRALQPDPIWITILVLKSCICILVKWQIQLFNTYRWLDVELMLV